MSGVRFGSSDQDTTIAPIRPMLWATHYGWPYNTISSYPSSVRKAGPSVVRNSPAPG